MYHKDMEVWKSSIELTLQIYKLTKSLPKDEIYGLIPQMRRCAASIPSNVAEGCGRYSDKETLKFISIALGSLAELDTQIIIVNKLGYIENTEEINELIKKVNALLLGLKRRLENDIN